MDVDFAPPLGYVEPVYKKNVPKQDDIVCFKHVFFKFKFIVFIIIKSEQVIKYPTKKDTKAPIGGAGYRLDGKAKKPEQLISQTQSKEMKNANNEEPEQHGIPNYDYVIGTLTFNRNIIKKNEEVSFFLEKSLTLKIIRHDGQLKNI
jgi:hypothetical protein